MPRYVALLALAAANQPAPPQQGARQVVDRSGVVWEPAWDQAGRQYFVDRATGRTSWQIDATQGAPAAPARPQAPSVSRLRPSTAPATSTATTTATTSVVKTRRRGPARGRRS